MRTLIVLYDGELKRDRWFPPLYEACRVLPVARREHCDRIRVERKLGALVAEFPVAVVERFQRASRMQLQPTTPIRRDSDTLETLRPVWALRS